MSFSVGSYGRRERGRERDGALGNYNFEKFGDRRGIPADSRGKASFRQVDCEQSSGRCQGACVE